VHPGNTVDAKTVQQITADFKERLPIDRCLVVGDSGLLCRENADRLEAMRTDAGKYVLETNQLDLPAQEAAVAYSQLEVVEDSIRRLKDTLQLRPLYHRTPHRVIGHVGLCVLALFLLRLLEERLLSAGLCHPAEAVLAAASSLQAVPVRIRDREFWPPPYVSTTAAAIFRAVGVAQVQERFQSDLNAAGLPSEP